VKPLVIFSFLLLWSAPQARSDSLWSPDFKGYLSGGKGLEKGDTVVVAVDSSSALSFTSTNSDSKSLTIEFSGGEGGNLFSFLPQVKTGGTLSAKGGEQYSLRAEVPATVTQTDQTGRALVSGTRSITLEGKEQSINLTGWVSPKDVDPRGRVALSRLADARLVFKTFLAPSQPILSDKDIQTIIAAAPAPAALATPAAPAGGRAPAPAAAAGQPGGAQAPAPAAAAPASPAVGAAAAQPAGAATPQPAAAPQLSLTDAKKKELLLLYLNRLIDILFSQ
jgi:hypothetical protein